MTKSITIKCNSCDEEIGYISYASESYLELNNLNMPHRGGAVYAMEISPHIRNTAHFCNLKCLKNWAINNINDGEMK